MCYTLCRQECVQDGSEYYLSIDSVVMVTNPDMIQHLLKINKYVNPLTVKPTMAVSLSLTTPASAALCEARSVCIPQECHCPNAAPFWQRTTQCQGQLLGICGCQWLLCSISRLQAHCAEGDPVSEHVALKHYCVQLSLSVHTPHVLSTAVVCGMSHTSAVSTW